MFNDWTWLKEHGAQPVAGGRHDQAPRFIDAVSVIGDELPRVRKALEAWGRAANKGNRDG